jgi:hypothetical protein
VATLACTPRDVQQLNSALTDAAVQVVQVAGNDTLSEPPMDYLEDGKINDAVIL